ncbi:ubiquitin-like protein-specific protease [Desmophyllum pertusum]|uniref:Ubiquitin carboxyl-terminal hydrolase n=1 Tax=Desmophyllum pertusum TaxID=174260 RepID=A0A9W9YK14_9CNID|nr:ubiquitin-like protein-specific protease [Desmophyllum pertusum]
MFGSLFETDEEKSEHDKSASTAGSSSSKQLICPHEPRGHTRICGLRNQGATCYLNSLLQTLFFTPEFRDGLFQLRAEDLSYDPNNETNSKGFQQQDVQELNRILFSALESSLVGTAGEAFIKNLYHGNISGLKKITLTFPDSRWMQWLGAEPVHELCLPWRSWKEPISTSVDHVTSMLMLGPRSGLFPPILTFSLLRFDYDFQRGERFKDNKRYSFPVTLNMNEFCESNCEVQGDQEYDLFSVVIHGGSCYGGHYHAYIRDAEGLGMWCSPETQQVRVVREGEDGQKDVINCGHPVDLITTLLRKLGGAASVNQLCQCMSKETGISWNKRFKNQYGPLTKFFKKHSDVFSFSDFSAGWVSLHNDGENSDNSVPVQSKEEPSSLGNDFHGRSTQSSSEGENLPDPGQCWFDVNDSRITCIHEKDLQHQFAGKESAYMLFYRRKNLLISMDDPILSVPDVLRAEVDEMNKVLFKQREDYDVCINQISVSVHFGDHYTVTDNILVLKQLDSFRDNVESQTLHIARRLPSGLHLFEELTHQEAVEIQKHFRKDTTIGEMKIMLCNSGGLNDQDLLLSWMKSKGKTSEIVPLHSNQVTRFEHFLLGLDVGERCRPMIGG